MTILTKPFSEKKDKLVPLVEHDNTLISSAPPATDIEAQNAHRRIIIFPAHARRVSSSTILCLLIIALAGVSVGIIGGKILYNEYLSVTRKIPMQGAYQRSEGWVQIPMPPQDDDYYVSEDDDISTKMLNDQDLKKWYAKLH